MPQAQVVLVESMASQVESGHHDPELHPPRSVKGVMLSSLLFGIISGRFTSAPNVLWDQSRAKQRVRAIDKDASHHWHTGSHSNSKGPECNCNCNCNYW